MQAMTDMLVAPVASLSSRMDVEQDASAVRFTGLAVFDGAQWASLCLELDIASCGSTSHEALFNLQDAVRQAREIAANEGLSAGEPVSDAAVTEFLSAHRGPLAVAAMTLVV
jgi:hypothetical protein